MSLVDKIRARITVAADGCWNWQGAKTAKGYGIVSWRGRRHYTHRAVFEDRSGQPIAPGLQIDHLCRNPSCCNPDHLEAVTPSENTRRGLSPVLSRLRREQKTHCCHGHAFTETNSYVDARGYRSCKACRKAKNEEWAKLRRSRGTFTAVAPAPPNRKGSHV